MAQLAKGKDPWECPSVHTLMKFPMRVGQNKQNKVSVAGPGLWGGHIFSRQMHQGYEPSNAGFRGILMKSPPCHQRQMEACGWKLLLAGWTEQPEWQ